jgi:hypothetical protein
MSLLNSADPYYIIGAQVIGAPIVKRYGLEALPTAYVLGRKGKRLRPFIGPRGDLRKHFNALNVVLYLYLLRLKRRMIKG